MGVGETGVGKMALTFCNFSFQCCFATSGICQYANVEATNCTLEVKILELKKTWKQGYTQITTLPCTSGKTGGGYVTDQED